MRKGLLLGIMLLGSFALCGLVSCETTLSVDEHSYVSPTSGLKTDITLDVNTKWTASSSADWCIISPTQGDKSVKRITLTVKSNYTPDDRECTVTISSKDKTETITVHQHQLDVIQAETSVLELSGNEQTFNVLVSSNIDYSVDISEEWIQFIGTKSVSSKQLSFIIEQNDGTNTRSGNIILRQKDGIESYILVQQKPREFIMLSTNTIDFTWDKAITNISVTSNVNYNIHIPDTCSWLHAEQMIDELSNNLIITADDYIPTPSTVLWPNVSDRKGVITLQYGEVSEEIIVTQSFRDYIWLSSERVKLYLGYNERIDAVAYLHSGINRTLRWESSDKSIATVDHGLITGISNGSTEIIVSNEDNSVSTTIPVVVKKVTDDIRVIAIGKSLSNSGGITTMVFHSILHWPTQVKNIKFLSVWLCSPDGTAYDIQGTSNGYVTFNPIYSNGPFGSIILNYYSSWYVIYQVEVDGEFYQFIGNLDASTWSSWLS